MIDFKRRYKINEEVYIFGDFSGGLPSIYKGKITGVQKGSGIYEFLYHVEAQNFIFLRFPDAIFKSVEEMAESLRDLVE